MQNIIHKQFQMKTVVAAILLLLGAALSACAQSTETKWVAPIPGAAILVHPIYHASLELKSEGKVILVDPSFDAKLIETLQAPDLILITDIHGDHMDPEILALLQTKYGAKPIIAPKAVADKLPVELRKNVKILANGESEKWGGFTIEAIPMYNLPDASQLFHPKGRGNGYILTLSGKRVYLSGDTEATHEMRQLKNIDLAFVCMNLPYTMDVDQAAAGVLDFKPKVVIPYHYKGTDGPSDIQKFKKLVEAGGRHIKVELLNFYP